MSDPAGDLPGFAAVAAQLESLAQILDEVKQELTGINESVGTIADILTAAAPTLGVQLPDPPG